MKPNKKLIMVQHADGKREYICPKCGSEMVYRDNYSMRFCNGDVVESGGEFLQCTNPDCMMTNDYPKMRASDFRHIPAIG